jgi:hypothetical protein
MKRPGLNAKTSALIISFLLVTCEIPDGMLHEIPLFSQDLWGEWIRMDTGEAWYFAGNYRMIGDSYYTSPVNMERQSQNVIKVTEGTGINAKDYFLYASRVRSSTFEASAVKGDDARALFARLVNVPKGTTAAIEAVKNGVDRQTVEIGGNGELEAENIIAGDDYKVTIDGYEFTVTPHTDGDNVGVLTLTGGVNIKTSIVPQSSSVDMMRLLSGESYDVAIKFTNIGETVSRAMSYQLTLPSELEITANANSPSRLTTGDLQSFMPGQTREVNITIRCGTISKDFEFKNITVDTVDFYGEKTWTDSVSLKINRESVTFYVRSNLAINGVVIVPNGKTYHFRTSGGSGIYSADIAVPRYPKDYLVVFSGASADTEAKYSFAMDRVPAVNFNDYSITALNKYWPNGTEEEASAVDYNQEVMAYLMMNEANYYRVSFIK